MVTEGKAGLLGGVCRGTGKEHRELAWGDGNGLLSLWMWGRGLHTCALSSEQAVPFLHGQTGCRPPTNVGVLPGPPWRQGEHFECLLPEGAYSNVHTSSSSLS